MKREIFYQSEHKFTSGEEVIIKYIEEHTKEFVKMNIQELAKSAFISAGSISKLCKKMGFKSYKEMQQWTLLQMNQYDKGKVINNPKSTPDIINNVKLNYEIAINRTTSDLSGKKINEAIKEINSSEYIFTYGIGSSSLAAEELAAGLTTVSFSAINLKSIHDIFLKLSDDKAAKSIVIIFSKSFSSKEIIVLREILKKQSIKLITITANTKLKENKYETLILFRTYEQTNRVVAMSSKVSQLLISDVIINKLKKKRSNSAYSLFDEQWRKG